MNRTAQVSGLVMVFFVTGFSVAEHAQHMSERSTLTNGFWGLNEALDPMGIDFALSVTNIYQANTKGGTSTH